MSITDYITQNDGFISSADAKKVSLYNELFDGTKNGLIIRVRRGVYAINEGLSRQMIDVKALVPGGILCLYSAWSHHELTTQIPQALNRLSVSNYRDHFYPQRWCIALYFATVGALIRE